MATATQVCEYLHDQFVKKGELVSVLLVNCLAHKLFTDNDIDHKFKLGYYNDYDTKQSYKYLWIEYNDKIYDLAHHINDDLVGIVPRHRDNGYLNYHQLYTLEPAFSRVDMETQLDKDYDKIVDHIYALVVSGKETYFNDLPIEYNKLLSYTLSVHH